MKPQIDRSLLDQLPIGGPIFDFNFCTESRLNNTRAFRACFTMEDDREETALVQKLAIRFNPKILN